MNTTKKQRKEKATEIMKELNIYAPYVDGFNEEDKVCLYEHYAGFWAEQYPELEAKIRKLEQKYNCTVYAITHEFAEFGELYDFLIVTDYPDEWEDLLYNYDDGHTVFAYVWNKTDEWCSEFGEISVKSFGGGIRREA